MSTATNRMHESQGPGAAENTSAARGMPSRLARRPDTTISSSTLFRAVRAHHSSLSAQTSASKRGAKARCAQNRGEAAGSLELRRQSANATLAASSATEIDSSAVVSSAAAPAALTPAGGLRAPCSVGPVVGGCGRDGVGCMATDDDLAGSPSGHAQLPWRLGSTLSASASRLARPCHIGAGTWRMWEACAFADRRRPRQRARTHSRLRERARTA